MPILDERLRRLSYYLRSAAQSSDLDRIRARLALADAVYTNIRNSVMSKVADGGVITHATQFAKINERLDRLEARDRPIAAQHIERIGDVERTTTVYQSPKEF